MEPGGEYDEIVIIWWNSDKKRQKKLKNERNDAIMLTSMVSNLTVGWDGSGVCKWDAGGKSCELWMKVESDDAITTSGWRGTMK